MCGQTGNGLKGSLLAAASCGKSSKEDCPYQNNNYFEADKEAQNDAAGCDFHCPAVPGCLSHATKAFKRPRDLLRTAACQQRTQGRLPLKGHYWSDAGLAQAAVSGPFLQRRRYGNSVGRGQRSPTSE